MKQGSKRRRRRRRKGRRRRNPRNPGFSQSAENFENDCVMLQEITGYLNTIK